MRYKLGCGPKHSIGQKKSQEGMAVGKLAMIPLTISALLL